MVDPKTSTDAHCMPRPKLWGLLVTFRRPTAVREMLAILDRQTLHVDNLIVVDNGSDAETARIVAGNGALYVEAGDNLGPAGGIALGMSHVLPQADDTDWLLLLDDDDPPTSDSLLEGLLAFAHECVRVDPRTAVVGLVGARYNPRRGVFSRVPDSDLTGAVPVDYIGGGQFPLYSVKAVRDVGTFSQSLFFGFDDAEYGLRMRRHGFSAYAHGKLWKAEREKHGRLGLEQRSQHLRTAPKTQAWRRYYSIRNATLLARTYAKPLVFIAVAGMGTGKALLAMSRSRASIRDLLLVLRGGVDGILGRSGRTVTPNTNTPKEHTPDPATGSHGESTR